MRAPADPALRAVEEACKRAVARAWPGIALRLREGLAASLGRGLAARLTLEEEEEGLTLSLPASMSAHLGAVEAVLAAQEGAIRDTLAAALRQSLEGKLP